MASPELSARLKYLNESAHFLSTVAPETSRHLISRCNALIFDSQLDETIAQRKNACKACGTLMIPGQQGTLSSRSRSAKITKKAKTLSQSVRPRAMVYECMACGQKTIENLRDRPPMKRVRKGQTVSMPAEESEAMVKASMKSTSSSKKRAKSRKRGLAAILAQKKAADVPTSGFDLMDFMKLA